MNKNIFRYHDGQRDRKGDPLKLLRRLWEELPSLDQKIDGYFSGEPEKRFPAQEELVKAARTVFEMPEWDEETESGCTEEEVLDVTWHFMEFLDKKKDDTDSMPTSPPPSDSALSVHSLESPTDLSLASG